MRGAGNQVEVTTAAFSTVFFLTRPDDNA
jgi:hypothetical protein